MQIKYPYYEWECYKNGLYNAINTSLYMEKIDLAEKCFLDIPSFEKGCLSVINEWPNSCATFLLNKRLNRRAWIGRAAVFYVTKCTERYSRESWNRLPSINKYHANIIADKVIRIYEKRSRIKNTGIYKQLEIEWI